MNRLPINAQGSGKQIGWIQLAAGRASFSNDLAEKLFVNYREVGGWNDQQTFDKLATGWSNGYATIPAANS